MNGKDGYAVYFFPSALEALGDAVKPYLQEGPTGPHLFCREIDTGGSLIEMTIDCPVADGRSVECELMVPTSMVRMIVSARADALFGFTSREAPLATLPPVGPTAVPVAAQSGALPATNTTPETTPPVETPPRP